MWSRSSIRRAETLKPYKPSVMTIRLGQAEELVHPFPPDAFMAIELAPEALAGVRGKVKYPAAFGL